MDKDLEQKETENLVDKFDSLMEGLFGFLIPAIFILALLTFVFAVSRGFPGP